MEVSSRYMDQQTYAIPPRKDNCPTIEDTITREKPRTR